MGYHDAFDYSRHLGEIRDLWRAQRGWQGAELRDEDMTIKLPAGLRECLGTLAGSATVAALERFWRACIESEEVASFVARVEQVLEGGTGVAVVRGLGPYRNEGAWGDALLALGSLLGWPVSQTQRGNLIARVENEGGQLDNPAVRGHKTNAALPYHCDRADRVGLLCIRQAPEGGESYVVSSIRLLADLERNYPDAARLLRSPVPQELRDGYGGEGQTWCAIPVFSEVEDSFTCRYIRRFIASAMQRQDVDIVDGLLGALDALDALLLEPPRAFRMRLQRGDLQLINNNVVLHARSRYRDSPVPDTGRLLLRLWLAHRTARPLPGEFGALYGPTAAGSLRGGVWPAGASRCISADLGFRSTG